MTTLIGGTRRPAASGCIGFWNSSITGWLGGDAPTTKSIGAVSSISMSLRPSASKTTKVFEAIHATIFRLYAEGLIDGVRVDHVDGLSLPETIVGDCARACTHWNTSGRRSCPGGQAYFVVEKILAHDEQLRPSWETDGTTGYDFMDEMSALQHDEAGEGPLSDAVASASAAARQISRPRKNRRAGRFCNEAFPRSARRRA